jgi:pimeloyl-ACP methyl ester carboxylesterase
MNEPGLNHPMRERPFTCESLAIRGLACHLQRWPGSGGPLCLLLHGWMDAGASFRFLVDALPAAWELVAPDWRGFGKSEWASGTYYFPEYLADLDALLARLSPDAPVWLIGHSMGGNVASLYAGIRPERVARLVSLEGLGLPPAPATAAPAHYRAWLTEQTDPREPRIYPDWTTLIDRLRRGNPRLTPEGAAVVARAWATETPDGPRLRADPHHKVRGPLLYRLDEARACWRNIQAPTLWVMGKDSPYARMDAALLAENRRCFRRLREVWLDDCGHMLHHDQPRALAQAIVDFIGAGGERG